MSNFDSYSGRLSFCLLLLACRIMPGNQSEWAKAMLTEFYYLENKCNALPWAAGCVIAAIIVRLDLMIIGNLKISRWLLAIEMIFCFIPLTFVWFDMLFGSSGVIQLNLEIIQMYFINSTTGQVMLVTMLSMSLVGILGPVGLIAAFRSILSGRSIYGSIFNRIQISGPIVLGMIYLSGWLLTPTALRFDHFGFLLLCSILPALGAAHIYYLYSPDRHKRISIS